MKLKTHLNKKKISCLYMCICMRACAHIVGMYMKVRGQLVGISYLMLCKFLVSNVTMLHPFSSIKVYFNIIVV